MLSNCCLSSVSLFCYFFLCCTFSCSFVNKSKNNSFIYGSDVSNHRTHFVGRWRHIFQMVINAIQHHCWISVIQTPSTNVPIYLLFAKTFLLTICPCYLIYWKHHYTFAVGYLKLLFSLYTIRVDINNLQLLYRSSDELAGNCGMQKC